MKKRKIKLDSQCAGAVPRLCLKKTLFIFTFIFLFSAAISAQSGPEAAGEIRATPADFKSDGCTLFPDGNYCDCCVRHDEIYYFGGTEKERRRADAELYKCVKAKKRFYNKLVAPLMYVGVRIGGAAWLPTPFRWGFGKNRKKSERANRGRPEKKPQEKVKGN